MLLALLLSASAIGPQALVQSPEPVVYGFGTRLFPPFEFVEGEDSSVTLNGVLFYPLPGPREGRVDYDAIRGSIPDSVAIEWHAKRQEFDAQLMARLRGSQTVREALGRIRDVYAERADVDSAAITGSGVRVYWSQAGQMDYIYPSTLQELLTGEPAPPDSVASAALRPVEQKRERYVRRFEQVVAAGGLYVFGNGYRMYRYPHNQEPLRTQLQSMDSALSRSGLEEIHSRYGKASPLGLLAEDLFRSRLMEE